MNDTNLLYKYKVSFTLLFSFHMFTFLCRYPFTNALMSSRTAQPRRFKMSLKSTERQQWTEADETYMMKAVECAKKGLTRTFPNPAVGCVLVKQTTGEIVGSGFHPRAGFPHAEIFALLEATGYVESGVASADSVINDSKSISATKVTELMNTYYSEGGPDKLFGNCFIETPVTAYVTLEPCSHYGRTPPCAATFALAKVNRVVIGYQDPNPRVDGGGVKVLENAGIQVDLAEGRQSKEACQTIISNFCKRITPRPDLGENYDYMTGKMRRSLRSIAGRKLHDNILPSIDWGGESVLLDENMEASVLSLPLKPEWMDHVDSILWQHELIQLKLNKAVAKRKGAKLLGDRIAEALNAHVAQSKGHTILLYRPGFPPVLDLEEIVEMEVS